MDFWQRLKSWLGHTDLPDADTDALYALSTAAVSLEVDLGWSFAGRGGICLKPLSTGNFRRVEQEMSQLVDAVAVENETKWWSEDDEFGYRWYVMEDPDLEDLVALIYTIGQQLTEAGYGDHLFAACFRFERTDDQPPASGGDAYVIYQYKQGTFYGFCPTGNRERDHAAEIEASSILSKELPWESDQSRWFALWDSPV